MGAVSFQNNLYKSFRSMPMDLKKILQNFGTFEFFSIFSGEMSHMAQNDLT